MNGLPSKDIREIIDELGEEIDEVIGKRKKEKYISTIFLLYSVIENLLKFYYASKLLWDETQIQVEHELKNQKYNVDFEKIRTRIKKMSFYSVIEESYHNGYIKKSFHENLQFIRKERNDITHQLWIYNQRNDNEEMLIILLKLRKTTKRILKYILNLIYDEIKLNESIAFELL